MEDVLTRDLAQESIDRDCEMYEHRRRQERKARYAAIHEFERWHRLHARCRTAGTPLQRDLQARFLKADTELLVATGQVQ